MENKISDVINQWESDLNYLENTLSTIVKSQRLWIEHFKTKMEQYKNI